MAEITTTAQAPSNPTPPSPLTTAAPAAQPAPRPRAGAIPDHQYDRLEPAERDRYARVRKAGPDGGSEWVHRDQLGKEPAADGTQPGTTPAPGTIKVGRIRTSESDIATLLEQKSQADLRKTQIPTTAEAYTATLPQDFKLPPGVEFQFNEADPAYVAARTWAHGQGFTQGQFSQLLSFYANSQAAEQVLIGNAAKAEVEKLGSMGTARVTAVDTWLRGMIGDELGRHVRGMMLTAKAVEGMERIMSKFATQGHASFSQFRSCA